MQYKLKDGKIVNSIPIGNSSVKIGEVSPDGMLTVCNRGPAPSSGRGAAVICKCKCGNYTLLKLNSFRNGSTKSCGCYNKEIHKNLCSQLGKQSKTKDYTKIENPYYSFINRTEEKNNVGYYWIIQCKQCGKQYKEIPSQLISNTRRKGNNPCECWKFQSKGILKIITLLKENNIPYEQEKTFDSCISPLGNSLKFDFFINNQYLIEYDGEQHFLPMSFGDNSQTGEEKLKLNQQYDKIKNKWCKDNNISLIRIPYTEYNDLCLEDLLLEKSKFLIKE